MGSSGSVCAEPQWKCELCSVMNSSYLSYCEVCLVPQGAQKDASLLKQLRSKLLSNECDDYIKADDIKEIVKQLCDDLKTLNRIHRDKQIALKIQKEINHIFEKNNIQCNPNIVQDFINLYHIDDKKKKFKKQRKMNAQCSPICTCGTEMKSTISDQCYDPSSYSYVLCDICDQIIKSGDTVFHCPRQKIPKIHSDGFDICLPCRKKYIHRLRKFVALIICPTMTDGNMDNRDAETLQNMFTKLGFHQIICLSEDEVSKHSVQTALQTLSPVNDTNVNQLTVICYSGHGELNKTGEYCFSLNGETLSSKELMQFQCKAATIGAVKDGLKIYLNEYRHKKIYRHNTLLLINSCHSQGVNHSVAAQKFADSFSKAKSLSILLSSLGIEVALVNGALSSIAAALGKSKLQCLQESCTGCLSLECIAGCFGLTVAEFVAISIVTGITFTALIVIATTCWVANDKSADCESVHAIASCHKQEESNATFGISPFVRYCNDFFNDFLDGKVPVPNRNDVHDSPSVLLKYLKNCYKEKEETMGGMSMQESGQNVCGSQRGFKDFAMCPIFKPN